MFPQDKRKFTIDDNGVYQGPRNWVHGTLGLRGKPVKSLGKLTRVSGTLDLEGTPIENLGKLKVVNTIILRNTSLTDLGLLHSADHIHLNEHITSLQNLREVKHIHLPVETSLKYIDMDKLDFYREMMVHFPHKERKEYKYYLSRFFWEIGQFKKIPIEEYPLHMNESNPYLRYKVEQYLRSHEKPIFMDF